MSADEKAPVSTGVYFDSASGRIVDSPPVEGVQLAAPGVELTPAVQALIDRFAESEPAAVDVPAPVKSAAKKAAAK